MSDEALERGVAAGRLAVDTRLRDALRAIRPTTARSAFPTRPPSPRSPSLARTSDDDALYAGEASVLVEIDGVVRAERRVDAFEERLAALERGLVTRARHRLARR